MARYKVLKPFRDKETKENYETNQEIEMSEERANEAIKNLKKWDGEFLERIDTNEGQVDGNDIEDMTVPQIKEVLDQLEVEYKSNATRNELVELLESAEKKAE